VLICVTPSLAQSIEELLDLANEVSNLSYADALSNLVGVSGISVNGESDLTLSTSPTLTGVATLDVELSKSLHLTATLSGEDFGVALKFKPFEYESVSDEILLKHMSDKVKLKTEVIDLFFDAMLKKREINQLSSQSTSLQNQSEIALDTSAYDYDVEVLGKLLSVHLKELDFPKLNIPKIPQKYVPYAFQSITRNEPNLSIGIKAEYSKNLSLEAFLSYSWNSDVTLKSQSENVESELLNTKKEMYFRNIHILSTIVKAYDKRISKMFEDYSQTYGEYLNGKASKSKVESISHQISLLGYERDLYCIKLLKTWYLYTYFGE